MSAVTGVPSVAPEAVHALRSVLMLFAAGAVIVGAILSVTVTICVAVAVLPFPSVTVQVTVVFPRGKAAGALLLPYRLRW